MVDIPQLPTWVSSDNYGYHKIPVFRVNIWLEDVQTAEINIWLWVIQRGEVYIS